jgi:hypothetical protein
MPGERSGRATTTKVDCAAKFGFPTAKGQYPFLHRGSPAYRLYVRDLYRRVYQQDAGDERFVPWHFARGLLEEEAGNSVNWARVVHCRMAKHRKGRPISQCLLANFRNLSKPFPFQFPKVPRGTPVATLGNNVPSMTNLEAAPTITTAPLVNSEAATAIKAEQTMVKDFGSATVSKLHPEFRTYDRFVNPRIQCWD